MLCIIKQAVFMYITYFSIELKEGVCYRQRETSRFVRNKQSRLVTFSLTAVLIVTNFNTCWLQFCRSITGNHFYTVEPRSKDTRLIRTPALYGQFRLSRQKVHIFSLKLTHFIRTPVNTDNGHFSGSRVTNSHILSTPLYGHWLSAHCLFSLSQLCDNCTHCTLFK